ncbi:hypothetical protein [Oceanicoccus sp. KOV_DT_Chl]|uniref:hypothetical protein n=1 Tax=Oceanicoccus sp. KOV_DT_Chl TaxID=1904639 RepID=UPI0011AF186C|nr:hypothetical protein [Oceanicoccus sp. KOV_DT_Chl]
MNYKNYLYFSTFFTFILVIVIASINYRVDPYGLYRPATKFSLSRINQFHHMRTIKPLKVYQLQPNAIVIGSSTAGRIAPQHPSWETYTSYNLSIPGITNYELLRLVQHSHATQPLMSLVIGLDFSAFLPSAPKLRRGFDDAALTNREGEISSIVTGWSRFKVHYRTLLSTTTLINSLSAILDKRTTHNTYFPSGNWYSGSKHIFSGIAGFKFTAKHQIELQTPYGPEQAMDFSYFVELLEFCHANKINTHFILMPVHIMYLEVYKHLNLMDEWRYWHDRLIAENNRLARQYQRDTYSIWGFNAAYDIVNEPLWNNIDSTKSWFQGGVHFNPHFGKIMLNETLSNDISPSHGIKLNKTNLATYLDQVEKINIDFLKEHEENTAQLIRQIKAPTSN